MAIKTYEMRMLGYESTFPVNVNGKKVYISFKKTLQDEGEGYLHTEDREIQKSIEVSDKFKNGDIRLISTTGVEDQEEDTVGTTTVVREDVTDYQTAREVLLGEPFNLKPQAVANNPDAILKAAAKINVSFPNLPTEE